MMQIHRSLPALAAIRTQTAPSLPHRTAGKPIATSDAHASTGWRHPERSARVDALPIETAIRRGDVPAGTTYRATLILHEIGPVDLTVIHRPCHIAIRLRSDCATSYAWLVSRKHLLECRLTSVLRHPSKVEVAYAG